MDSILLVEDDENLSRGISYFLSKFEYDIHVVNSLADASDMVINNSFNLIILDINLPDGNGFDFLKENSNHLETPIIVLTANNGEFDEVMGLELGAEDYICKPFSLSVLKARIDRVIKRNKEKDNEKKIHLIAGELSLDLDEYRAFGNGNEILLSRTEFKLIKILLENKGMVLSKELLLSRLWDDDGNFVDENTVAVNISRIRKKLEENNIEPHIIKTIHGIGYKLEV